MYDHRNRLSWFLLRIPAGRGHHQALDALYTGLLARKVSWGLDLDIRSFFDKISREWLVKFVEHRIADRCVVRLIQEWAEYWRWRMGSGYGWKEECPRAAVHPLWPTSTLLHPGCDP